MTVIIDTYRGGTDTGNMINNQYEKNLLLKLSKYMANQFEKLGIDTELVRTTDVSLSDDERNSIINELKGSNDIIIQNRYSQIGELNIIYPLRSSDELASLISSNLSKEGINVTKYYQRRLPIDTMLDYYTVIRNTKPNEALIIEYNDLLNYEEVVNIIVNSISEYLKLENTYTVKKGDSLYQIAKKYGTTVNEIKKLNNLTSNLLSINQILKIPSITKAEDTTSDLTTYTVKKGDSLYQIAKKYGTTVNEIKKLNNLTSNLLSINQVLKIPGSKEDEYFLYTVVSGDSLYQIAKKYGTTVNEIKKLNNLTNNLLSINQVLKIPR